MDWNDNPYSIILFFGAALGLLLVFLGWQRRHARGGSMFTGVMLAVTIWAAGYAFELGLPSIEAKTFAAQVEYVGIVTVPMFWLFFMVMYTGNTAWLTFDKVFFFSIEPVVILLLVWTNNSHHLIWKTVTLDTSGLVTVFKATYGIGFYLNIAYTYILLVTSTILLVRQAVHSSGNRRKQMLIILPGALAPWVGNLAYVILGLPIDLTPFGFLVTGLVVIWSLYNYQLLEISSSVRQLVFDNMPNSIVIIGGDGAVLDANPATEEMFSAERSEILGKSPAHLWLREEDPQTVDQMIRQEIDTEGHWTRKIRYVRQDGKTGVAEVVVKPLLDKNGWRIASIGVTRDITERKGHERILHFEPSKEDTFE